jgi:hypothetical protein
LQHGLNFYDGKTNRYIDDFTAVKNTAVVNATTPTTIITATNRRPSGVITSDKIMDFIDNTDYRISTDPVREDKKRITTMMKSS